MHFMWNCIDVALLVAPIVYACMQAAAGKNAMHAMCTGLYRA